MRRVILGPPLPVSPGAFALRMTTSMARVAMEMVRSSAGSEHRTAPARLCEAGRYNLLSGGWHYRVPVPDDGGLCLGRRLAHRGRRLVVHGLPRAIRFQD